jgi:acetoin utilization deacetylase AcuC-like enzyme
MPRRLTIYTHPAFQEHRTPADHPERPARVAAIEQALREAGLDRHPEVAWVTPEPASEVHLRRVHTTEYLESLASAGVEGLRALDPDTYIGPRSLEAAKLASGAACAGVDAVLAGHSSSALILGRPPGHHALADRAMGFCLLNHAAVAAAHALTQGLSRVAVLDWDVHHGNGTEAIFYEDPRVFYCSIHRDPFWPGTGRAYRRGAGAGEGFNLNVPLSEDATADDVRGAFLDAIQQVRAAHQPELIVLSAGFDWHREDPLGQGSLEDSDFAAMTRDLRAVFTHDGLAKGIVSILEGGYRLDALARSVVAHAQALVEA